MVLSGHSEYVKMKFAGCHDSVAFLALKIVHAADIHHLMKSLMRGENNREIINELYLSEST
jgi:hypothetical protein